MKKIGFKNGMEKPRNEENPHPTEVGFAGGAGAPPPPPPDDDDPDDPPIDPETLKRMDEHLKELARPEIRGIIEKDLTKLSNLSSIEGLSEARMKILREYECFRLVNLMLSEKKLLPVYLSKSSASEDEKLFLRELIIRFQDLGSKFRKAEIFLQGRENPFDGYHADYGFSTNNGRIIIHFKSYSDGEIAWQVKDHPEHFMVHAFHVIQLVDHALKTFQIDSLFSTKEGAEHLIHLIGMLEESVKSLKGNIG